MNTSTTTQANVISSANNPAVQQFLENQFKMLESFFKFHAMQCKHSKQTSLPFLNEIKQQQNRQEMLSKCRKAAIDKLESTTNVNVVKVFDYSSKKASISKPTRSTVTFKRMNNQAAVNKQIVQHSRRNKYAFVDRVNAINKLESKSNINVVKVFDNSSSKKATKPSTKRIYNKTAINKQIVEHARRNVFACVDRVNAINKLESKSNINTIKVFDNSTKKTATKATRCSATFKKMNNQAAINKQIISKAKRNTNARVNAIKQLESTSNINVIKVFDHNKTNENCDTHATTNNSNYRSNTITNEKIATLKHNIEYLESTLAIDRKSAISALLANNNNLVDAIVHLLQ